MQAAMTPFQSGLCAYLTKQRKEAEQIEHCF